LLHETLHALGLKHPDSGAGAAESPVQAIPDTVMSTSAIAGLALGGLSRYPAEPMPLDLLALQALYGSVAGNSGDTVYDLSAPRWNDGFRVIWDSDGVDVLDASGCTDGVTLDLRQGARSGLGTEVFAFAQVQTGPRPETVSDTYAQTLTVARGSAIENAVGSDFDDVLTGNELANRLTGGGGSDRIDGGDGSDTAVYEGPRSRYAVDVDGVGRLLVRDKLDGATDTLSSIEWLAFSDGPAVRAAEAIGLASSSLPALHTAEAFRLYQAAFDRLPDMAGLVYQTQALDSGLALAGLAGNFIQSNEFNRNYGALDDLQFVTRLYLNVLHRQPDEGGLAFHAARLAAGNSRADLLVSFSDSAEHQAALVGVIQDSLGLS
ncbi:MAG: DUF4214 domain-containing protein, partial [Ramlibacter sp.]